MAQFQPDTETDESNLMEIFCSYMDQNELMMEDPQGWLNIRFLSDNQVESFLYQRSSCNAISLLFMLVFKLSNKQQQVIQHV